MSDISSTKRVSDGFSEHYTPTTEEVRLNYAPFKTFPADAEAQFDRWLAEVKADAWQEGYTAGKPYPQLISKNPYWDGEAND